MKPINWNWIWRVLGHIMPGVAFFTISMLFSYLSIALGTYDTYMLLVIGAMGGFILGWAVFYFALFKPVERIFEKCMRIQEKFIDDLMETMKPPRVDGDEWKDN